LDPQPVERLTSPDVRARLFRPARSSDQPIDELEKQDACQHREPGKYPELRGLARLALGNPCIIWMRDGV
jgi:hypothetical protein